jgi:hypothetical protein
MKQIGQILGWVDNLFYFISNLMTSAKNIINFQFTIYMCVYSTLSPSHWSKQTMMRRMDDQMNVKHHFIHLSHHCKALACVPSLPIAFFVTLHLYSILSSLRQRKQTMKRLMDDQTDGQMNDETDG